MVETPPTQGNLPLVTRKPGELIRWWPCDHTPHGEIITDGFKHQAVGGGKNMLVGTVYGDLLGLMGDGVSAHPAANRLGHCLLLLRIFPGPTDR